MVKGKCNIMVVIIKFKIFEFGYVLIVYNRWFYIGELSG